MADFKKLKDGQGNSYNVKDETARTNLASHTGNTSNPHSVTKAQVGLGNVDNTSDANKPISNAQATVNAAKFDKANVKLSPGSTPSDDNVLSEKYSEDHYTKHNTYDGTLSVKKADEATAAKNLEPVSSASGSTQTAPFINQGTATNNNDSQAEVDTGTLGQHLEKRGNTVAVNQLVDNYNFPSNPQTHEWYNFDDSYGNTSISGNVATWTCTNIPDQYYQTGFAQSNYMSIPYDHKILVIARVRSSISTTVAIYGVKTNTHNRSVYISVSANTWTLFYGYMADRTSADEIITRPHICFATTDNVVADVTLECSLCQFIDLTQWFNGNNNIPADLLAHPDNWGNYYNGLLASNAGQLVNCNGRYLVNGHQNVWDEVTEAGSIDNDGQDTSGSGTFRTVGYTQVIPNRDYVVNTRKLVIYEYDENKTFIQMTSSYENLGEGMVFKTQPNTKYIRFRSSNYGSATYNHDITISLYYEGEDYSTYIPYEAPAVYDTGSEELLAFDTKDPDGTWHKNTGTKADLSQLIWNTSDNMKYTQISDMRIAGHNVKMSKYVYYKYNDIQTLSNLPVGGFTKSSNYIYVNDSTPSGSFQYELADESKTTEQGTPFTENMDINDMGNMAWYSAYTDENTNTPVAVPQGCKIFYPAWYAGFIDTLGQREDIDWVPDEIVSQEQISDSALSDRGYIKLTSITGYDATKTQVLKNVEGTLTWVDEE